MPGDDLPVFVRMAAQPNGQRVARTCSEQMYGVKVAGIA